MFTNQLQNWLAGDANLICQQITGSLRTPTQKPKAILSGSFNPLHPGHVQLAKSAEKKLGEVVDFEISITNVDKPALSMDEIQKRLTQFVGKAHVWLTKAPRFYEKAMLFPYTTMVIGYDTAIRLIDPNYYQGSQELRDAKLQTIREFGCRFLVAGRVDALGQFHTAEEIHIPKQLEGLFDSIEESDFRMDISSTQLRETQDLRYR